METGESNINHDNAWAKDQLGELIPVDCHAISDSQSGLKSILNEIRKK